MKGYTFIRGVDGFGEDITPAYEEGVYLNYEKAYEKLKKLTKECVENDKYYGFKEKDYSKSVFLKKLNEKIDEIQKYEIPPINYYKMVEVEIIM